MAKTTEKLIMSAADVSRAVKRIAQEIIEKNKGAEDVVLVGIIDGGVELSRRLAQAIEKEEGIKIQFGSLDVSFYRDDLAVRGKNIMPKKSDINFSIDKKVVVLVDDVLFHGRTVRAALDNLTDYGRPSKVQLAVLIDRGNRELPIQPDFSGKNITTTMEDNVKVFLSEDGTEDKVTVR